MLVVTSPGLRHLDETGHMGRKEERKEKSAPSGVMTEASVPRSSLRGQNSMVTSAGRSLCTQKQPERAELYGYVSRQVIYSRVQLFDMVRSSEWFYASTLARANSCRTAMAPALQNKLACEASACMP